MGDGSAEYSLVTLADFDFWGKAFRTKQIPLVDERSEQCTSLFRFHGVPGGWPDSLCPLWRVLPVGVEGLLGRSLLLGGWAPV